MKYLLAGGIAAGVLVLGGTWAAASTAQNSSDDTGDGRPLVADGAPRERIAERKADKAERKAERAVERMHGAMSAEAIAAAQAAFDSYAQCLRDEGLDVADVTVGEPNSDGSALATGPRTPDERLAERFGQDAADQAWIDANAVCEPALRDALVEVRADARAEMADDMADGMGGDMGRQRDLMGPPHGPRD